MKKFFSKFVAIGLTLALALTMAPLSYAAILPENFRVISVNGEGKVSATANKAVISLTIENTAKTARAAKSRNNEVMNKIRSALATYGVTKNDVRLEWSNSYKAYGMGMMEKSMPTVEGAGLGMDSYTANYTVSVMIKDVSKVNDISDLLSEMDGVNVGSSSYILDNNETDTDKARELAVQDAKKKAEKLAKLYNVQIGKITSVSESSYTQPKGAGMYGYGGQSSEMELVLNLYVTYEVN